eukprot:765172-Hanusia_phi.AAC.3
MMKRTWTEQGPFDAVVGHSQGAILITVRKTRLRGLADAQFKVLLTRALLSDFPFKVHPRSTLPLSPPPSSSLLAPPPPPHPMSSNLSCYPHQELKFALLSPLRRFFSVSELSPPPPPALLPAHRRTAAGAAWPNPFDAELNELVAADLASLSYTPQTLHVYA